MIEFFKRFFKKKEKVSEKTNEKHINELLKIFNNEVAGIKDDIYKFRGFYPEVNELFGKLNESLIKLENAESSEEVYPQLKTAINSARDRILKIKIPEIKEPKNFEDFKGINNSLTVFFKNINSIKPKYVDLVNILYKNEMRNLAGNIKDIKLIGDEFGEKLNNKIKRIEKNEKITFNLTLLKKKLIEINKLREKKEKTIKEINNLKNYKKTRENELIKIKNSEEYKKLQEIKKEINEINKKIESLKTDFTNKLSTVKKALKIYYHGLKTKEYIDLFQNPFLINEKRILEILKNIKDLILKEKIRLKASKKEKTLKAIEIIDENLIKSFREEHENLKDLKTKKNEEIKSIKIRDLGKIQAEISRIGNSINFLERESNNNLEENKKQEGFFESTKKQTEELIFKNLNEKIFIKF